MDELPTDDEVPVEAGYRVARVRQELRQGGEPAPELRHGEGVGQPGVVHIS